MKNRNQAANEILSAVFWVSLTIQAVLISGSFFFARRIDFGDSFLYEIIFAAVFVLVSLFNLSYILIVHVKSTVVRLLSLITFAILFAAVAYGCS